MSIRVPRRPLLGGLVAAAVVAGAALWSGAPSSPAAPAAPEAVAVRQTVPVPRASVVGAVRGRVPWRAPLRVAVSGATVTSAVATEGSGLRVHGARDRTGWRSAATLVPSTDYRVVLTVRDGADVERRLTVTARTAKAERVVRAALSPGDDTVVGVGKPIALTLDRDVVEPAARAAVVARLTVRARPGTQGAWRWMDARTVHYRPARFWKPGTRVSVHADLDRLRLPGGVWGADVRTTRFRVGDALVSTVDVRRKTMTVRRNGEVVRVMRASMGKRQFPTRNGTFIVLEKFARRIMDSATLDLPPGTPAYRLGVDSAVRISNSGTFTHAAPWSIADQGVRNVSHGCINLSPADARWFYSRAQRGDVVRVVGSTEGPLSWDAGSRDWNMSFAEWQRGASG